MRILCASDPDPTGTLAHMNQCTASEYGTPGHVYGLDHGRTGAPAGEVLSAELGELGELGELAKIRRKAKRPIQAKK